MRKKASYGIAYKYDNISEDEFLSLVRLMFLAQSIGVKQVVKILNKFRVFSAIDIHGLKSCLEIEVDILKDTFKSIQGFDQKVFSRLKDWIDFFGCTANEAKEYIEYFDLHKDLTKNLSLKASTNALNPKKIQAMLDEYVIGQNVAKRILSTATYTHLIRTGITRPIIRKVYTEEPYSTAPVLPNPNIVIIGSTGTGKSFMVKTIARLFELSLLKIDCASLTASGYMGNNLNDCLYNFFEELRPNQNEINRSMLFFDEFDKLSDHNTKRLEGSVGGVEMQQEFLHMLEEKEFLLTPPKGSKGDSYTINLNECMFVFGGSFSGIEAIIRKRTGINATLGFRKTETSADQPSIYSHVKPPDLVAFGIIPELVGRINHIVSLEDHTKETIVSIIKKSKDSALKAYENFFNIHFDSLTIKEEVYDLIAEKVLESKTGARAINSIFNELLKDYMYKTPNLEIEHIVIDKECFYKVFS